MKIQSVTFLCDARGCDEQATVLEESDTAAYLALVDKGWKVARNPMGWKHLCVTHERGDLK